jgi:hypothetical protein
MEHFEEVRSFGDFSGVFFSDFLFVGRCSMSLYVTLIPKLASSRKGVVFHPLHTPDDDPNQHSHCWDRWLNHKRGFIWLCLKLGYPVNPLVYHGLSQFCVFKLHELGGITPSLDWFKEKTRQFLLVKTKVSPRAPVQGWSCDKCASAATVSTSATASRRLRLQRVPKARGVGWGFATWIWGIIYVSTDVWHLDIWPTNQSFGGSIRALSIVSMRHSV